MAKVTPRSLVDFVKEKKRADCLVCRLPTDVREQVEAASDKRILRNEVVAWLNEECGVAATTKDLERHTQGRHAS